MYSIKARSHVQLLVTALLMGVLFSISLPNARAEEPIKPASTTINLGDMEVLIKQLFEQIKTLQTQLAELQKQQASSGLSKPIQKTSDKEYNIEVLENLRVRAEAGLAGQPVKVQMKGMRGMIMDGPVERGDMKWYKIKYSDGTIGWSASNWLRVTEQTKELKKEIKEEPKDKKLNEQRPCTLDVEICPDGNYVSRTGPYCQFICKKTDPTSASQ